MKVGVIGSGRIGGNVGRLLARAGHEVLFSFSHEQAKLQSLAAETGNGSRAGTPREAAESGEAVLLAVPWWEIDNSLRIAGVEDGVLDGKVVIDATNPFRPGWIPMNLPEGTTALRINSERMPASRVVKAFNTLTAGFQAESSGRVGPDRVVMFYAGDDADAKAIVSRLIDDAGFEPVEVGDSNDVAWMEPPRRPGALYGEEFHPREAREIVAKLTGRSPTEEPAASYTARRAFENFRRGANTGEWGPYLDMVTDDYTFWYPVPGPFLGANVGRERIAAFFREASAAEADVKVAFSPAHRAALDGDTAVFEFEVEGTVGGGPFKNRIAISFDVRSEKVSGHREYIGDLSPFLTASSARG